MSEEKLNLEQYSSLEVAYTQVKDVLIQQRETIRDYSSKAIMLLATATAIVGIGLPIGFSQSLGKVIIFSNFSARDIAIIPILIYVTLAMIAWRAYRFTKVKTMNNPVVIFKEFLKLSPSEFYYEILLHTINGFQENESIIKEKQQWLTCLVPLVVAEAIVVILWVAFVTALPLIS